MRYTVDEVGRMRVTLIVHVERLEEIGGAPAYTRALGEH
jgi:hypothetical protein